MSGYRKLAKGFRRVTTESGTRATVFYLTLSGAPDTLPKIGEKFSRDRDDKELLVRNIEETLLGDLNTNNLWRVFYSTEAGVESAPDRSAPTIEMDHSFDIGANMLNIGPQANATWTTGGADVTQDMFLLVPEGSIRIERVFRSYSRLMAKIVTFAGKVNSKTFEGWPPGQVLFVGATASRFTNWFGFRRWRAALVFNVRTVKWNELWDKDNSRFDTTSVTLYEEADLDVILRPN